MNWIEFIIILLSNSGYIFSHLINAVRGNSDGKCMTNLMNGLANEAFSSSSYQENFYPHQARVIFDKTNTNSSFGLAWCPKGEIGSEPTEWIQVSFDSLKMISNIFTYGRDNGNFGFFVPTYHFDYQRENGSLWHRYRQLDGTTSILGNYDSRNAQVKSFFSNIVARTIRLIPISDMTIKVCLKFSLYGCDFNDGVVEYSIPQGNTLVDPGGHKYRLIDRVYDTIESKHMWLPNAMLRGGIGQLMDNQINTDSIQSTKDSVFNFIGWHRNFTKNHVTMLFRFDQTRKMIGVRLHMLNNFNNKISIFSSIKFEFSIGGEIYGVRYKDVVYDHDSDTHLMEARWVRIHLNNSIAKHVRVTLTFLLDWMVITEVVFETIPVYQIILEESLNKSIVTRNTASHNENGTNTPAKMNYLISIFGGLVAFVILIIVTIFFVLRIRRHRKRRFKGKTNQSILYGNMPINNVIPMPIVNSTNGGFYKPVPSGVYDCMLPYQTPTISSRNVTGFAGQSNLQLFGTFNNRGNGSANTPRMVNGLSTDNYKGALSPIIRQHSFNQNITSLLSESKRASIDGSYAATGSNPDYSNSTVNREPISGDNVAFLPIHLVAITPAMYSKFQIPNNGHQVRMSCNNNPTEDQSIDPITIRWSEELADIIARHSRFESILQSPVGGSLVARQNHEYDDNGSADRYEREIYNRIQPIDSSQIDIQTIIGSGRYGSMFKGVYNGETVLVKSIDRSCASAQRVIFLRAISDLMKLSSKNIATVIGYCNYSSSESCIISPDQIFDPIINCVIIEHSRYTDLHTFIRMFSSKSKHSGINFKNDSETSSTSTEDETCDQPIRPLLSQSCLIYIASQISNGMSFFEREYLVHRDLSARNCLLGPKLSIKITDTAMDNKLFQDDYVPLNEVLRNIAAIGLSPLVMDHQTDVTLPLHWMSWEAVLKADYSIKSDIWSFGVVLWEMLTNCLTRPYFTVPQPPCHTISMDTKIVHCLSLIYNFKCLSHGSNEALLPNNESLIKLQQTTQWLRPLPLSIPFVQVDGTPSSTRRQQIDDNNSALQNCTSHILNCSREMRDLIESCWSKEPSVRPNFRDINMFLDQKINGFNADEEYQVLQIGLRSKVDDSVGYS